MRKLLPAGAGLVLTSLLTSLLSAGVPAVAATATGATTFTIKIVNVSAKDALKVPGAAAVKAPIAPGAFLVDKSAAIFAPGEHASAALQSLAEDGNFEPLQKALVAKFGAQAGMFVPGLAFTVTAKPGDRLSFATMFVQSNDKFYAPADGAVALFDAAGKPISGDLTAFVRLFDAGTEIDEQPGAGANQAPRQMAPNQGADQNAVVTAADDGYDYPAASQVIRLEIKAGE